MTTLIPTQLPLILSLSKDARGERRLSLSKPENVTGASGTQHLNGYAA
jgi:hypothetical protein